MSFNDVGRRKFGLAVGALWLDILPVDAAVTTKLFSFAALNGGREIRTPESDSNVQGDALVTVDSRDKSRSYAISYSTTLEGSVEVAAHVHGAAWAGQSASATVTIRPIRDGLSAVCSPKSSRVDPLTGKQAGQMRKGLFCLNARGSTTETFEDLKR